MHKTIHKKILTCQLLDNDQLYMYYVTISRSSIYVFLSFNYIVSVAVRISLKSIDRK